MFKLENNKETLMKVASIILLNYSFSPQIIRQNLFWTETSQAR